MKGNELETFHLAHRSPVDFFNAPLELLPVIRPVRMIIIMTVLHRTEFVLKKQCTHQLHAQREPCLTPLLPAVVEQSHAFHVAKSRLACLYPREIIRLLRCKRFENHLPENVEERAAAHRFFYQCNEWLPTCYHQTQTRLRDGA